jgi:hypothetical protein
MLVFLQRWTCDRGIEFKLFNPTSNVRDRLTLVARFEVLISLRPGNDVTYA